MLENSPKYIAAAGRYPHWAVPYIQMAPTVFILRQVGIERVCHIKFQYREPYSKSRRRKRRPSVYNVPSGGAGGVDPLHMIKAGRVGREGVLGVL